MFALDLLQDLSPTEPDDRQLLTKSVSSQEPLPKALAKLQSSEVESFERHMNGDDGYRVLEVRPSRV